MEKKRSARRKRVGPLRNGKCNLFTEEVVIAISLNKSSYHSSERRIWNEYYKTVIHFEFLGL